MSIFSPVHLNYTFSLGGGFRRLNLFLFILISGMRRQPNKNEKEKQSISVSF